MVPPLVKVNARYYGWRVALYIAGVMNLSIVATALLLHYAFEAAGETPRSARRVEEVTRFAFDYTFFLNVVAVGVSVAMVVPLSRRRREGESGHDHGKGLDAQTVVAYASLAVVAVGLVAYGGWSAAVHPFPGLVPGSSRRCSCLARRRSRKTSPKRRRRSFPLSTRRTPRLSGTSLRARTPTPGSSPTCSACRGASTRPRRTETRLLKAVAEEKRWRAIHLACHGRVDARRPQLSSLALAPDAMNDGRLTVLEIYRHPMPADLTVPSACETARGRIYGAEGVVGLTRAFLFAGSPRVIVSLWKVDDEATRVLMAKLYELWKGGAPAAAALRRVQAHVASHAKWRGPAFWAAWQLWGLPD